MLLLLACAAEPLPVEARLYTFQADVREGPDAGTSLPGTLLTAPDLDAAAFAGGGAHLGVPAEHSDEDVELRFALDAGTIVGSGTVGQVEMLGELTGPGDGDTGDWLGTRDATIPWAAEDEPGSDVLPACLADVSYGGATGTLVVAEDDTVGLTGFVVPDGSGATLALSVADAGFVLRGEEGETYEAAVTGSVSDCSFAASGAEFTAKAYTATLGEGHGDIVDVLVEVPTDTIQSGVSKVFELTVAVGGR